MSRQKRSAALLAGLMGGAGLLHFAAPKVFDPTVPRILPGKARSWTYASGAVELALAAGLAHPRTRPLAARATAGFLVGVFPAMCRWRSTGATAPAPTARGLCATAPATAAGPVGARGGARCRAAVNGVSRQPYGPVTG